MKKIPYLLSLLALAFTACKETEAVKPATVSRQQASANNTVRVDLVIHSQEPAQFSYLYAEEAGSGVVKTGEPKTLKVVPDTKIRLLGEGATFYLNGKKLEVNTFTVTGSCQVVAEFSPN